MGLSTVVLLFKAPVVNPINHKARSIPILNPINRYGRVFFFSWLGFMVAFLSWYAFPPLLTVTIKKDLKMSQNDVANSNIIALLATLLVRFVCGPLCDRFGPRYVFVGALLVGAIPTVLAGTVTTPKGFIALRFFVGILGASFVPCQVWCTGFFDKNCVGSANALAAGWGNSGGGITYFVMPAIFDSLVKHSHMSAHKAWRVAYIVPFIIITAVALAMLFLCEDTPTGKWSERHLHFKQTAESHGIASRIVDVPQATVIDENVAALRNNGAVDGDKKEHLDGKDGYDHEAQMDTQEMVDIAIGEVVVAPTRKEAFKILLSPQSWALAAPYGCSFGAELAINSIIGAYYLHNFPKLGQTKSGDWAAMFGLLNVVFRPLGGFISDFIYRKTHSVWAKKLWLVFLGIMMGVFELAIGFTNPHRKSTMFGLVAGFAFFLEACNGANFSVVPHVHPFANGILSGMVGGTGNLGGIIFAIIFRYNGVHYNKVLWIIGIISIGVNCAVGWIPPIPKGQIGGR